MISVIIPTFNEEKYIGILLESLSKQDCARDIEVVVADAFSKDKTRDIAKSFSDNFKNLIVVDGGMPAISRNKGAKASSGDLLFFIDADLLIKDIDFLSKASIFFRKEKLGISTVYLEPLSTHPLDRIMMGFYALCLYLSKYFRALGAMCIIADRKVFEEVGGYPENVIMNEDHDLMLKASHVGKYAVTPYWVFFSVRRMEKEGRFQLVWKYTQAIYYNVLFGPITKPVIKYEFGYSDEKAENITKS